MSFLCRYATSVFFRYIFVATLYHELRWSSMITCGTILLLCLAVRFMFLRDTVKYLCVLSLFFAAVKSRFCLFVANKTPVPLASRSLPCYTMVASFCAYLPPDFPVPLLYADHQQVLSALEAIPVQPPLYLQQVELQSRPVSSVSQSPPRGAPCVLQLRS